jgi:hypothetical protein
MPESTVETSELVVPKSIPTILLIEELSQAEAKMTARIFEPGRWKGERA